MKTSSIAPVIRRVFLALMLLVCGSFAAYTAVTDTVMDAEGRVLKYRYGIPDGHNTATPSGFLVYFHGNNANTQDELLDMWYPSTRYRADQYGLIPVVMTSPDVRTDGVTRQWDYEKDSELVHRLITTDFKGAFAVDMKKVYLNGGSQGACFVNGLLTIKGNAYEGGAFAWCGCLDYSDLSWEASENFKSNFRIFVANTTEDFLWEAGVNTYQYYKYHIGVANVEKDLDSPGDHCVEPNGLYDKAWNYIMTGDIASPSAFEPHWRRTHLFSDPVALALTPDNKVVVADHREGATDLYVSNQNRTQWTLASTIADSILDMSIMPSGVWSVIGHDSLYFSEDSGKSFTPQGMYQDNNHLSKEGTLAGISYRGAVETSTDGIYWKTNLTYPTYDYNYLITREDNFGQFDAGATLWLRSVSYTGGDFVEIYSRSAYPFDSTSTELATFPNSLHGDSILHVAEFGDSIAVWYKTNGVQYLSTSVDDGGSWSSAVLPIPDDSYSGIYHQISRLALLPSGDLLVIGIPFAQRSTDFGQTWESEPGLGYFFDTELLMDHSQNLFLIQREAGLYRYFPTENSLLAVSSMTSSNSSSSSNPASSMGSSSSNASSSATGLGTPEYVFQNSIQVQQAQLIVNVNRPQKVTIEVFNLQGKKQFEHTFKAQLGESSIPLGSLFSVAKSGPGVFYIRARSKSLNQTISVENILAQ